MSGEQCPCLEKDSTDIIDEQQIIVPWLLIIFAIGGGGKTLPSWGYTVISSRSKNSPLQICWVLSSSN